MNKEHVCIQSTYPLTIASKKLFQPSAIFPGNWCFIDMQNLCKGVQSKGWRIDWKQFREYLSKYYQVTQAILFMGYLHSSAGFYYKLRKSGFKLEFRPVRQLSNGVIDGGNIDADLAASVMDNKNEYSQAIIIADDSDYYNTIRSLTRQNKLKAVISTHSLAKHLN